jgi:WD40 repeat protein
LESFHPRKIGEHQLISGDNSHAAGPAAIEPAGRVQRLYQLSARRSRSQGGTVAAHDRGVGLFELGRPQQPAQVHPIKDLQREGLTLMEFSPDGTVLATASADGTARLWQSLTGTAAGAVLQHGDAVLALAFSPDGQLVLTSSRDKMARLWEARTGKALGPPLLHPAGVSAVAFSPTGNAFLTQSHDSVRLWKTPRLIEGDPDYLILAVQTITGMELEEEGVFRLLDARTWQERCDRLHQMSNPFLDK